MILKPARRVVVLAAAVLFLGPTSALAGNEEVARDTGRGIAAVIATIYYAPVKIAYAAGGLVAGGLAWAVTGGNDEVARAVILPAVQGDFVITPDHIRGDRPLVFVAQPRAAEQDFAVDVAAPPPAAAQQEPPAE